MTASMKLHCLVTLACVGILWPTLDTKAARPNIVFIVADDLGYGELGSFGGREIPTPHAVHSPLQGADEYMQRFTHIPDIHRRIFAAMLSHLDDGVGRVLERLRTEGIADHTLVVFLSDNGGATRELTSSNHPFRGEKGQLLEGGIRVPMIARWPARLPAGCGESRMVSSLDLLPTVLAAAGAPVPAGLDGANLLPHLTGANDAPIRDNHYWRMGGRAALRDGDWKIHRPDKFGKTRVGRIQVTPPRTPTPAVRCRDR